METNDLTTVEEQQVNEEQQAETSIEEPQVEEIPSTTDKDYQDAYDDVWSKDVNDTDVLNNIEDTSTTADPLQVADDNNIEDTSTNGTNNSIGAFMTDKPVLKYKGKDVPIDSADELIALAQKGFSYETEMSNIKPKKKTLNIVDGIPHEVLQAVADLNKGNKGAIDYLKKTYGIEDTVPEVDTFGFDEKPKETTKEAYKPEIPQSDPVMDIWNEYTAKAPTQAAKATEIYSALDESFKAEVYQPKVFPHFLQAVESGEFETVYPVAVKHKTLNPTITWLQAYKMAVDGFQANSSTKEPPVEATPPKQTESKRQMSDASAADRVWNDPEYFKELEAKIFA